MEQIPPDHLFFVNPAQLAPHPDFGPLASWFVREDIEADTRLHTLADFMRLPNLARDLLDDRSAVGTTKALVIGRGDRLAVFYQTEERGIRPFIDAINAYSATLIIAFPSPTPPKNARDVDYLFHVEGGNDGGRSARMIECELGAPRGSPGLFTAGDRRSVGAVLETLERS